MSRILAALAIAITLTACRKPEPKGVIRLDPELESLVPTDTLFLMGADVDAIRNTPVYQKHIGIVALPRLNEFTRQTGVDPRKDLSYVLSTSNGKAGVFMAQGKFNTADLEARLEKQGARRTRYKNYDLLGDTRNAVVFIHANVAIAGAADLLQSILDGRAQPRRGLPPELAARVSTIRSGSQIWAAFIGGVEGLKVTAPEGSNLANAIGLLKGIDNAGLGIDLRTGFDLNGDAVCKTEENAKQLRLALKGVIGLGRLSTPDSRSDLLKIYDAIQVDQAQTKVLVSAHVPPELVDKFVDLWLKGR